MKDAEFLELKLKATIVPQQIRWPDDALHWQKVHEVVNEARTRLAQTWSAMDEVERDGDLSSDGKARQRNKLAAKAIADFQASKTLAEARDAVGRIAEGAAVKALKDAEAGWLKAIQKIAQKGGLAAK